MPDERADDAVAVGLGVPLNGVADIAEVVADLHLLDPEHQALLGDAHQALRRFIDVPDRDGDRGVGDVAFEGGADVDREQIAVLQHAVARHAVHDLIVDRRADRRRVTVVADEGRHAAHRADRLIGEPVELAGGDTWFAPPPSARSASSR